MDVWYNLAKGILKAYLTLFIDSIHLYGKENLPPGPKIIVANHPNVTDGFILPFIIQEKIHFLIEAEAFAVPLVGRLLALADQIPVVIGRGQEALAAARVRLALGHTVAIFPEGRLSGNKGFRRAGAGAALLALESQAPLVPVGFYVSPEFVRTLRTRLFNREVVGWWQFGGRCAVQIGEPWLPNLVARKDSSYPLLRELTDRLMIRIELLVQQAAKAI